MEQDKGIAEGKAACEQLISSTIKVVRAAQELSKRTFCERTWDGILCWPPAKPRELLYQPCPAFILGFDENMSRKNVSIEDLLEYSEMSERGNLYFPKNVPLFITVRHIRPIIESLGTNSYGFNDFSTLSSLSGVLKSHSKIKYFLASEEFGSHILVATCDMLVLVTEANATKFCDDAGEWWVHPEHNTSWTNYSDCSESGYVTLAPFPEAEPLHIKWVPYVKAVSRFGYVASLIFLILACIILFSYRRLRCPRNTIHLHLFVSFLMRACTALLKDNLMVEGVAFSDGVLQYNDEIRYTQTTQCWECKAFTTFWQYGILANYSWILIEGVYFHNLIFMALFSHTSSITLYVLFGWSLPGLFVLLWALARIFLEDTLCWTTNTLGYVFLLIQVPTVTSIVINLILFINITRVLYIKLNNSFLVNRKISRYRKWAKSTLILMPLYGVHYALFHGFMYSKNPTVHILWLFFDQIFASTQGLFVSIIYCISNGEVIQELKRSWRNLRSWLRPRKEEFDLTNRVVNKDSKILELTQFHSTD